MALLDGGVQSREVGEGGQLEEFALLDLKVVLAGLLADPAPGLGGVYQM